MDLSQLTAKTLKVSRGFTYQYYTSPAKASKPTLLLFHGWPDSALLWAGLINNYLLPNGYGVVAIDCLGYGGTSKPTELDAYAWQHLMADVAEIVDAEQLGKVVSMGHDWGAGMAQRFYNFYPARVSGLVLVNAAYTPPTGTFDLEAVNKITKQTFGHGIYEYWHFLTAEDAPSIMTKKLDSVYTICHGEPTTWIENWCSPGGMRKYITEDRTQPLLPYAQGLHKTDFYDRFGQEGAFDAANCYYKATLHGVQDATDTLIPEEGKRVTVPAFFWGCEHDAVCRPAIMQSSIDAGLLTDIESVIRDGGHWNLLAQPELFGKDILGWLEGRTFAA
ncbi:Bifunctional epoxide hydrolase 2 [Paramyrothecium foliicola]|nr:Bifunctional epoxide hydrolase 2 [Paramyrothecium foliicola]